MCLWNTDAPDGNKVKISQKPPTFWPCPTPGACDVSEVWGTNRRTYSPKFGNCMTTQTLIIALFMLAGRNYGQMDRQTDDLMPPVDF